MDRWSAISLRVLPWRVWARWIGSFLSFLSVTRLNIFSRLGRPGYHDFLEISLRSFFPQTVPAFFIKKFTPPQVCPFRYSQGFFLTLLSETNRRYCWRTYPVFVVRLFFYNNRIITPLENMADLSMNPIKGLSVSTIQLMNS